jgi:hypothetical protein
MGLSLCLASVQACAGKKGAAQTAKGPESAGVKADAKSQAATAKKPVTAEEAEEAQAVTKDGITILKSVACKSVENRQPVAEAAVFPPNVGRVYLYTHIRHASGSEASVLHVWNHNGKKMATVTLPVKAANWRTYSSKTINPSLLGEWRVDVATTKGEVIKSVTFRVEAPKK